METSSNSTKDMASFPHDVRGSALYREAKALFRALLAPGLGRPSAVVDLAVSPDGRQLAFAGSVPGALDEPIPSRICLVDVEGRSLQVVTAGPGNDLSPRWSSDGSIVAFRSDRRRAGDFQLYFLNVCTGKISAAPMVEGWLEWLAYSPNGEQLLLGVAGHGADISGAQGSRSSRLSAAEQIPAWMPAVDAGFELYKRRSVWVMDLGTDRLTRAVPSDLNVWEACWCGNGAVVALVTAGAQEHAWYEAHLVHADLRSGQVKWLYQPRDQIGQLSGSPDGRQLAYVEAVCSDRCLVAGNLHVIDLHQGTASVIDTGRIDVSFTYWRDNNRLLIAGLRNLGTVVADLEVSSRSLHERWASDEFYCPNVFYPYAAPVPGHGDDFVIGACSHLRPMELMYVRGTVAIPILGLGHEGTETATRELRRIEPYRWRAPDGEAMEGWLMRGAGKGVAPLLMDVHGGPIWRWSPFFIGRQPHHILLAARGYAIFWPNPRGSSGRGQEFARTVVGDMGGDDTVDLLSGIDSLIADGIADPRRLGVTGVSYGGYMTSWLITQDPRFAAAVSVAPVTNWISQHLTSNIPCWDRQYLAARYTDPTGRYYGRSPIMGAHRVKTPTLNICGALDRSTPPGQAMEFHNALLEHGVPSTLVTYPQEGHGVRTLPATIDYTARVVDWFTKYLSP